MNILLLSPGFKREPKEATGITLLLYARFLESKGHKVTIISDGPKARRFRVGKIDVRIFRADGVLSSIKTHVVGYIGPGWSLKDIEVIHNFSASPLIVARGFFFKMRFPKAKFFHTLKSYSRSRNGRFMFSFLLRLCDKVTVPTEIMRKKVISAGCSSNKVLVVRSPISLDRFKVRDKERLKEIYGFKGKKIVFYYGAMFKNKGAHILIRAIPKIVKAVKDVHFIFAPRYSGAEIEEHKKKIKSLKMDAYCTFKEGKVKIEDFVSMADVVPLPYLDLYGTEGNPSCLLEAAASKTPVVTTELPELKEIMRPDKEILMARPGDADSLSLKIIKILDDKILNKRISEAAYKRSKDYDIKKIGKRFLDIYRNG